MENEENVKETEETVKDSQESTGEKDSVDQSEANDTKEETGTELNEQNPKPKEELLEQKVLYTNDLIEAKKFTLQIDHYMTTGDMLVAMLLATNIVVMLLCRLLRDRK